MGLPFPEVRTWKAEIKHSAETVLSLILNVASLYFFSGFLPCKVSFYCPDLLFASILPFQVVCFLPSAFFLNVPPILVDFHVFFMDYI